MRMSCALLLWLCCLMAPLSAAEVFYQVSPATPMPEDTLAVSVWAPDMWRIREITLTGPDGKAMSMTALQNHYVGRIQLGNLTPGKYPVLIVIQDESKTPRQYTFWVTVAEWSAESEVLRRRLQEVIGRIGMLLQEKETVLSKMPEVPVSPEQASLTSQIIDAYAVRANAESQDLAERRKEDTSGNILLAKPLFYPVSDQEVLGNLQTYAALLASELAWIQQFQDRPSTALPDIERWRLYTIDRTHGRQDFRAFWPTSNVASTEKVFDGRDTVILDHIRKLRLALQRADIRADIQRLEQRKSRAVEDYEQTLMEKTKLKETMNTLTEAVKKKISEYHGSTPNAAAE
jgi:hypothetical protein